MAVMDTTQNVCHDALPLVRDGLAILANPRALHGSGGEGDKMVLDNLWRLLQMWQANPDMAGMDSAPRMGMPAVDGHALLGQVIGRCLTQPDLDMTAIHKTLKDHVVPQALPWASGIERARALECLTALQVGLDSV